MVTWQNFTEGVILHHGRPLYYIMKQPGIEILQRPPPRIMSGGHSTIGIDNFHHTGVIILIMSQIIARSWQYLCLLVLEISDGGAGSADSMYCK